MIYTSLDVKYLQGDSLSLCNTFVDWLLIFHCKLSIKRWNTVNNHYLYHENIIKIIWCILHLRGMWVVMRECCLCFGTTWSVDKRNISIQKSWKRSPIKVTIKTHLKEYEKEKRMRAGFHWRTERSEVWDTTFDLCMHAWTSTDKRKSKYYEFRRLFYEMISLLILK